MVCFLYPQMVRKFVWEHIRLGALFGLGPTGSGLLLDGALIRMYGVRCRDADGLVGLAFAAPGDDKSDGR